MTEWQPYKGIFCGIQLNGWYVAGTNGNEFDAMVAQSPWGWVAEVDKVGCNFLTEEEAKEWAEGKLGGAK